MDEKVLEILSGLGGGAAVTVIAWSLLYMIWKRYELANSDRIIEIVRRADVCETDRLELRRELIDLSTKMYAFEVDYMTRITNAMEANSVALRDLTAVIERPGRKPRT